MPYWKKNPAIYEINTWVWLSEMSRETDRRISLGSVPGEKWDELAGMNPDAVWLMGVWERSPAGIAISNANPGNLADFRRALPDFTPADNVGSPYCVRRYHVDPFLGGDEGLAVARRQLADRGIKLILDFVPNHLAHDHPWVAGRPEFFIRGNAGDLARDPVTFVKYGDNVFACGKDPFYPAWQDVLQVNAFHPGLREAIVEEVLRISGQCDGLRCDMAMLMINDIFGRTWGDRAGDRPEAEYWEMLIPAVKRINADFIFIAEAYWDTEWQLQQQGFDYCYDKRLYDRLEKETAAKIRLHLTAATAFQSKLVRFIENHDEPRQASIFRNGKGRAALVVCSTLPGARLYHEGQFTGRRIRLPVFLRRRPWEPADREFHAFALNLVGIVQKSVFREGEWRLCDASGWPGNESWRELLTWCWNDADERCLVVVNYSSRTGRGRIRVPWNDPATGNVVLTDLLSGLTYPRNWDEISRDGLYVELAPWESHIFSFQQAQPQT
jgi:glycosidase